MSRVGMPSVMQTTSGDAGIGGFHDGVGGEWRRHKDHGGIGAGFLHGLRHGVEHRQGPDACCRPLPGVTPPTTLVP